MRLIINGEKREFNDGTTIKEILEELKIADKVMACALNLEVVKKDEWDSCMPKDGDKVEFLWFVGGG